MPEVADLLLLQQKLRLAESELGMGHMLVNDTVKIAPYETAVLWQGDRVDAVSGLPEPVPNTPFNDWITGQCKKLNKQDGREVSRIDVGELDRESQDRWREFLSAEALWVPLTSHGEKLGGLLLCRGQAWRDEEMSILGYWGLAAGHAIQALRNKSDVRQYWWQNLANRKTLWVVLGLVFLLMWIPVNLTVTASAEIVPKNPEVVRAPIEGIIGDVHVEPNQFIEAGALVLSFDDTIIQTQLDVAEQELAIASAEYQRANQAAVADRRVASQLPMLKARVEQNRAQVSYNQSLMQRSRVYAERDAIAIVPSVEELRGRPVQIGEKIMTLAEPESSELEFWLAVGDSIPLPENAELELFLNVYPDEVHYGRVRYITYQAEVSPDGILGFRGRAEFPEETTLRVGWRGTARVIGEPVFFGYYIFRRPLSVLRQWTGL